MFRICGGTQTVTATVAALLFATGAHAPVTRTQYDVVAAGDTVTEALVALRIGEVVLPDMPVYH